MEKIIHQIWVGNKQRPTRWMDSWKVMNPNFEYRLWTEDDIENLMLSNRKLYEQYMGMSCFYGASDVVRIEVLSLFGGIYIDADTKCVRSLETAPFVKNDFFCVMSHYLEGHDNRLSNGVIGSVPHHPILEKYIQKMGEAKEIMPPWSTIGGTLFTKCVDEDVTILSPYTFLSRGSSGLAEPPHRDIVVYGEHFWGETHGLYGEPINE